MRRKTVERGASPNEAAVAKEFADRLSARLSERRARVDEQRARTLWAKLPTARGIERKEERGPFDWSWLWVPGSIAALPVMGLFPPWGLLTVLAFLGFFGIRTWLRDRE